MDANSKARRRDNSRPLLESFRLVSYVLAASFITATILFLLVGLPIAYVFLVHLLFASVITLLLFVMDKRRARSDQRRISEINLLTMSAIGGAGGALLAMGTTRHKTHHATFMMLVPLLLFTHLVIAALLLWG